MKGALSLITILLSCTLTFSQAYEANVQYDKKKQTGIAIDFPYSDEAVKNAIVKKLSDMGFKAKEEKGILNRDRGFLVYKNIYIVDITDERLDYMIKVDSKGRKGNDGAILYMIIMKGDKNAVTSTGSDIAENAKEFLADLLPEVEAADLELQIKDQQEVVAKAEKKLSDLKDDQASLEKRLQQNKTDQENTQKDIESQKQTLGTLIGKRKSSN